MDLEHYDFSVGSKTLIRATEGTICDRLPPRIKVREKAGIELPHIMVLIDDPEKTVIEPLFDEQLEKVYDFPLMADSGHLTGYMIDNINIINKVAATIETLASPEVFKKKYNVDDNDPLIYAMGDGNHSLATAKAIWEQLKKDTTDTASIMDNPARYALVELVNLHDEGLEFEAIFRTVFNIDTENMLSDMQAFFKSQGATVNITEYPTVAEAQKASAEISNESNHLIEFVTEKTAGTIEVVNPKLTLETATIQDFIDDYLSTHADATVDYIHGEDVVTDLGKKPGNIGFLLPSISKHSLFKTIILDGALPRKTFSMGEADEKRFYVECRKIK